MSDLIDRQSAVDALMAEPLKWDDSSVWESARCHQWMMDMDVIKALPSTQPEIIYCKDCKHRPTATRADEKVFYGFSVKFPDEKCPCYCEDGWYGWYPEDDFYCGYAERRTDDRQRNVLQRLRQEYLWEVS